MKFSGERFVPQETDNELAIEHMQRYHSIIELVKGKVILDAASGEGYGSFLLSQHAKKVIGMDISSEAVTHSKITYKKDNLSYIQGSVEDLPFEDHSIDVVVSFETIEHVNQDIQKQFLSEIKRVLTVDGILIMSTPDKYIYTDLPGYFNKFHVKEFYKEEFHQFLNNYFSFVEFYNQKFEVFSIIANSNSSKLSKISLDSNEEMNHGKYIIAVCSNSQVANIDLSSIVANKQLELLRQRILTLQEEVEARNAHIHLLDQQILEKNQQIIEKDKQILEVDYLKQQVGFYKDELVHVKNENKLFLTQIQLQNQSFDKAINITNSLDQQLKENSEKLTSLESKVFAMQQELEAKAALIREFSTVHNTINSQIETYTNRQEIISNNFNEIDAIINNQKAHIEQLLEEERKLNNILQSGGWRALNKYYGLRDKIFPNNSKRRVLAKLTFKALKNPKQLLKKINKQNFKKLNYYLHTDDPAMIENRIDNYFERHEETPSTKIVLFDKSDISQKLVFENCDNPTVSIVIPVYNQFHYTYVCLKSILENSTDVNYEIIIADDMSQDETINIVQYAENITVVRDGTNRGFLLNCNNAAKYANGKYVLFLNNDTNVQKDWLSHLVTLIESDTTIGMVGSKLIYPDGRQQEAGGIIWSDASGWNYGRLDDPEKSEYNYVKEVDYISGAAIMIRKDLWNEIGGFDERYVPAYYEDSDLAFEVRKRGYKVVLQPKSVVVHFEGISHGTDEGTGIKSYQVKNKEKFVQKWGQVLKDEHFNNAEHVFWARDRSRNKKNILVIDHYVPHYDKDAGSRTVYQYIKLFIDLGFNVKFVGDNFFRHEPYTSELQTMGVEVLYGDWYASHFTDWLKLNGQYFDYTYLNRPHISIKYIDQIKKFTKSKVFYYGHDLHYMRELREYDLTKNEELLKSSDEWRTIENSLISKADVVYYPSQVEVNEVKAHFPNISVRAIPGYIYDSFPDEVSIPFDERQNLLFVGGFGHKPNIDAVLWFAKEIFPFIAEGIPGIKWYIVGSNPPDTIKGMESSHIKVTGYVSDEELCGFYKSCKLVVVPLRYGAGVKGKVIEALYHQIPIITTTIGSEGLQNAERYLIESDDPKEFAKYVIDIYNNPEVLLEMSQKSREFVETYYSKESVLKLIAEDFKI